MASLGDLVVTVGAQISGFKDAMQEVDKILGGLGQKAEEFLNHFEGLGSRLVQGLAIGALATAVFEAGETIDNALIEISRLTGATGEDLERFGETFKSVFAGAVQSSDDLAGGLALLSQRTGATGEDLKSLLEINSKLAEVTGQKLVPLIEQTQKVFAAWGVTVAEQPAKLDALLAISQKTGVSISILGGMMQGTGATLRAMGLSFNDAAALMANFETHGVNTSRVMMTLNQSLVNLEKEGVTDARARLGELIKSVIDAKDPMDALSIAAQEFKGKGIVPLVDALRLGVTNIEDLRSAANGSIGAVAKAADASEEFSERLTKLKNQTALLLAPLGVELVAALTKIVESAGAGIRVLSELGASFNGLTGTVQIVVGGLAAISAALLIFSTESVLGAISAIGAFSTAMTTEFIASTMAGTAALSELSLAGLVTGFEAAGASAVAFGTSVSAMGLSITAALSEISFSSILAGLSSMTFSVQAVASAVGTLSAGALASLAGVLSTLAIAALAVGAAFAGWKLGEWLRENIPLAKQFGDFLGDWILKIPGVNALIMQFSGANEGVAKANADLTATTQALSAKLAEHGVIVKRGMMSLEEYAIALQEAAKSAKPLGDAAGAASIHIGNLAASFAALGVKVAPTPEAINKITNALEFVQHAYESGAVSLQVYNAAVDAFGKKMKEAFGEHDWAGPIDALGDALKNAGIKSYSDELEKLRTAQTLAAEAFAAGRIGPEEYAEAIDKTNEAVKKAHPITQQLIDDLKKTGQMFEDIDAQILKNTDAQGQALGSLGEKIGELKAPLQSVDAILSSFGIKTVAQTEARIKTLNAQLAGAVAAMKVGVPGAAQAADEALRRLYQIANGPKLLDEQKLGIPDLQTLQMQLDSNVKAYQRLIANGVLNYRQAMQAEIALLRERIYVGQQAGENTDQLQVKLDHMTEALKRQNEGWAVTIRNIHQTMESGLSQAFDDMIFHIDRVADDFKKLGESVVDIFLNHIIKLAIQPALNALDGLLAKLGSVITQSLGITTPTFSGAKIPGLGGGDKGGIPGVDGLPGIDLGSGGGAGGAAASAATSSLTGIVGAVAGVVSAVSDVISNFQLARQEGTLNAIEAHTKVLAIGLVGISAPWEKQAKGQFSIFDTLNTYLPMIEGIGESVRASLAPYLIDISGKLNALVVGTLTALLSVGGDVKSGATATATSIAAALSAATATSAAGMEAGLIAVRDKLIDLKSAVLDSTSAQTRQLESALGTLADNIYKSMNPLGMVGTILGAIGGGIGSLGAGLGSGIGNAIGGAIGGVANAITGPRQEGTLNSIEEHTKVMSIAMVGISAPWEKVAEGQDTMFEKFGQIRNALVGNLPWITEFTHGIHAVLKDDILVVLRDISDKIKGGIQITQTAPISPVVPAEPTTAPPQPPTPAQPTVIVPPTPVTIVQPVQEAQSILGVPLLFGALVDGFSNAVKGGIDRLLASLSASDKIFRDYAVDSLGYSTSELTLIETISGAITRLGSDAITAITDVGLDTAEMTQSLRSIEAKMSTADSGKGTVQQVTFAAGAIQINGAQDPAATAKAVMDLLKTQSPVFV